MDPSTTPFLSNTVLRRKRWIEAIRIFVGSILTSASIGAATSHGSTSIGRFILLDGIPFACILYLVRRVVPAVRIRSTALAIIFRSAAYLGFFFTAMLLALFSLTTSEKAIQVLREGWRFFLGMSLFMYALALVITVIRGMSRKLGPGVFWDWLRGYYYTPKEEERIFMFLDMRRSTEIAENLGDLKFSSLVQDFFDDLASPVIETRGQVSHYIGDEAVITWWPRKGLQNANCLQIFFRLQAILNQRRDYYLHEYGFVPEFKAGAHVGNVVATEVGAVKNQAMGSIKSEIVFHGDVLNTTARVQNACSDLGVDFLITEDLAKLIPQTEWHDLKPMGDVNLKGKADRVKLLSVVLRPQAETMK